MIESCFNDAEIYIRQRQYKQAFECCQIIIALNNNSDDYFSRTGGLKSHNKYVKYLETKLMDGEHAYEDYLEIVKKKRAKLLRCLK